MRFWLSVVLAWPAGFRLGGEVFRFRGRVQRPWEPHLRGQWCYSGLRGLADLLVPLPPPFANLFAFHVRDRCGVVPPGAALTGSGIPEFFVVPMEAAALRVTTNCWHKRLP